MIDPIMSIAMTPRTQSEAQKLMPWEDEVKGKAKSIITLAATLVVLGTLTVVATWV